MKDIVDSGEIIIRMGNRFAQRLFNGRRKIAADTNIRAKNATVVNASPEVKLGS